MTNARIRSAFGEFITGADAKFPGLPRNVRYLTVATLCAIVNNILLIALVKAGINYFIGIWIAFVPMIFLGYVLHAGITFQVTTSRSTLLRYTVAMLANYPLWIISLFVLRTILKLPIEFAAPAGTAIAFAGNYLSTHWAILRSMTAAFVGSHEPEEKPAVDQRLLESFVSEYSFQPATALWRAIEIPALIGLGIPGGRGLDVGCGDGKLTAILLRCIGDRDLVGVDPDPLESGEAARRNVYRSVHNCGADKIPEPDASFDFAMSNSVLEHIPDLDAVLSETSRVVRPNGVLLITVPHGAFHGQLRGPILPGVSRARYNARLDRRLMHLRYPTGAEWSQLLDRHGFTTEKMEFYLDRAQVRRWESISRLTAGMLSVLSGGHFHPIVMQRRLGFRKIQNRTALPRLLASIIAALLRSGLRDRSSERREDNTGCVAIRCRKRA